VAALNILIRYHPSSLATYPNPLLLNIESLTADIISISHPSTTLMGFVRDQYK